ncbi:hypothetical protein T05_14781, partial [Trichinella murrelli]
MSLMLPHTTLEKHVYKAGNSSKNSVHDGINFFLRVDLSPIAEIFNLDVLTINITMLTIAAQMFIAVWKQNAAEDLLAKKTTIVGTLRRNKTEVPSELTEAMGRE